MTDISEASTPELLERIVACFRTERVPYVLIGAWALSVWGTSRATNDVDFLVLVDEKELSRLSNRLIQPGFELDETWMKWNPMLRGVQLRFQFHGVTVDLLRPRDVHDQQVFRRNDENGWTDVFTDSCLGKILSCKSLKSGGPGTSKTRYPFWSVPERAWTNDILVDGLLESGYRRNFVTFFLFKLRRPFKRGEADEPFNRLRADF